MRRATVRQATSEDYASVCELFRQVDDVHAALLPRYFRKVRGPARSREFVARILRSPDEALLVAANSLGRVVGLVHVQLYETPPIASMVARRRAHVDNLVVERRARRGGHGRRLMDAAALWARERGAEELVLTVWAGNGTAERFYEALGFAKVNTVLGRALR